MFKDIINSVLSLLGTKSKISATEYTPNGDIDTRKFEGLRLHVYDDSRGIATIGYGHNLEGGNDEHLAQLGLSQSQLISGSRDLTQEEADQLFDLDYADARREARRLVPELDSMPPVVQLILGDLTFNMGYGKLAQFHRTLAAFNARDWQAAADDLQESLWYRQTGHRAKVIVDTLYNL